MQEITLPRTLNRILLITKGNRCKLNCVSLVVCVLFVSMANAQTPNNNSPIWGSGSQNVLGTPLHVDDQTWGTLPSQQTLNPNSSRRNANQARTYRNAMGNLLLTDGNGNIVYDNNGNPAIDSAALNQQSFLDPNNNDPASIPPPVDPADVPIDGGIGILLIVGMGVGYKNKRKKL